MFIPKAILKPDYGLLFYIKVLVCKNYIGCIFFVVLHLPKQKDPLLDLPNCNNWVGIKLNYYVIHNMHSDPLQELINK